MTRFRTIAATAVSVIALMMAVPSVAHAQESAQSEEIIVTATKRAANIQDVPFSINAQTQQDIERSGATNLEELTRNVPGVSIQNLGPGQSQVSIRGVSAGQIVRDQPGVKEQVGVYLDESVISLSLFTPDLDLYDLNRVETLRGPQGTLFGSGSVGGTIRYITNQPTLGENSGSLEANVNTLTDGGTGGHVKGMVNYAIGTNAALRVVGYHTEYAGFIDALREGGGRDEDVNSGTRSGIRAALRLEASPRLTITPRVVYQDVTMDGFNRRDVYNLYANPFQTTPTTFGDREQYLLLNEQFKDETFIGDITVNYDLGFADLTSVSSYTSRNILVSRDASALTGSVTIDLAMAPAAVLLPSNLRDATDLSQVTQEVRLSSKGDGPFDWLVGAFFSDVTREYSQRLPTPGYDVYTDLRFGAGTSVAVANGFPADSPYNSDLPYDIEQFAVFGEGTYQVSDRLDVTVGLRAYDFSEERDFVSGGLFSNGDRRHDRTSSNGWTPRVMVSYELNDSTKINAQASEGFRLGGVNDPLNIPLCSPSDVSIFGAFQSYEDETSWNYEVGFKHQAGGITFNAAAYYNKIEDLQVTLDAGSCSSRISFNVPEAHAEGVEFELSATPVHGLELSLAGNWTEAEFDSTVRDGLNNIIGGLQSGNRLPSVPEYQVAATAAYYWPLMNEYEGFVAASARTVGSRFTQPSDQVAGAGNFTSGLPFRGATGAEVTRVNLELDPYTTVNLNAGIQSDVWSITAYVNNVTDENADLGFDRERGGRARVGFNVMTPRTYGITVRRNF